MSKGLVLEKFRTKYIALLNELKRELVSRYPDRAQRAEYVTDVLVHKAYALDLHSLADFIHTLYLACTEFKEICRLMPSPKEVDELFE